jgi:hypothetical protein
VRESIVVVLCSCQCACLLCWWGLPKLWWFGSISDFLGSWVFEYYIYCIQMVYWWNTYKLFCSRRLVSCACPFELPHATEGGLLWLLVVYSFHFVAWYRSSCCMICWDCGYRSLLCDMEEFVEGVLWSIVMCVVGGSNSWVAGWQPHFFAWKHLICRMILDWGILWLEYSARCVFRGCVSLLYSYTPVKRGVPFGCILRATLHD